MKVFNCEQQSEEWFAIKLGKVSASRFSEVLNKKTGRRTYMLKLLAERLSGETAPSYSNKAMDFGAEYEPRARAYYEALYGKIEQVGFVELNEDVGCSPDGLVGENGLIEIKCPYPSTHLSYIDKNVLPAVYKPQVQGQLWVTGRKWCDFVSYNPKIKARPFWKIRIFRDEDYIKELKICTTMFVIEMKEMIEKLTRNDF